MRRHPSPIVVTGCLVCQEMEEAGVSLRVSCNCAMGHDSCRVVSCRVYSDPIDKKMKLVFTSVIDRLSELVAVRHAACGQC